MIDQGTLGAIRFIDVPTGEAPEEVRKEWVGVEVPCLYFDPANSTSVGVATGNPVSTYAAYVVLQSHAIEALAKKSTQAAQYWNHIGYPQGPFAAFSFNAESAEVVRPVMSKDEFMGPLAVI